MTGADIATIALGSTAIAGAVSGALVWVHRRGGDERELSVELKANTAATRDLTAKFERLTDRYEARHEALSGRVDDHETRIAVLETRRGRLGGRTRHRPGVTDREGASWRYREPQGISGHPQADATSFAFESASSIMVELVSSPEIAGSFSAWLSVSLTDGIPEFSNAAAQNIAVPPTGALPSIVSSFQGSSATGVVPYSAFLSPAGHSDGSAGGNPALAEAAGGAA